jgi:hypothetical protein
MLITYVITVRSFIKEFEMKLFGYVVDANFISDRSLTDIGFYEWTDGIRVLALGKLLVSMGPEQFCDCCGVGIGLDLELCDKCRERKC